MLTVSHPFAAINTRAVPEKAAPANTAPQPCPRLGKRVHLCYPEKHAAARRRTTNGTGTDMAEYELVKRAKSAG
jgi:hypothetical protein